MDRDVDLGTGYALKRVLLGRPLATSRLEHERLGKATALAVFSSDNMSSVAYATEEILRVLIISVGVAAFSYVLPISFVIVLIEAILIFSYRQTIKAYPTAGGAYIVTKDNLGLLPAQLAGVALLVDYVLTVSVSTAAGVQAISSVVPLAVPTRIVLSLVFVWLIAYANLLGVRESGKIFAAPTYLFIVSLGITCAAGIYQVFTGHLQPFSIPAQEAAGGLKIGFATVATTALVLRAFASGGAAVTGVEAISNGVPAFRKPEWRNAQITLVWMGLILGSTFLAVSFLAARLHVIPVADESKSVLATIAQAVYGTSFAGHLLFLVLQIGTTLILILAANTSFADFPRLASFHAGDAFMPRQLTKRGHRLVFSNGIVALAAAASGIIILFRASVTAMIPLYALGVFTSFTLSQTGMAKRHLRLREEGWLFGLFVNGLGAASTFVVSIVIAYSKFKKGAWMVMLAVPILVAILVRVNKTYEGEDEQLVIGPEDRANGMGQRSSHIAIVLVDDLTRDTMHALQYALTIRPTRIVAVRFGRNDPLFDHAWASTGIRIPLTSLPGDERPGWLIAEHLRDLGAVEGQVTVIMPVPQDEGGVARLRRAHLWAGIAASLRELPDVGVVLVRSHEHQGGHPDGSPISPRRRHVAMILVEDLDRAVLKAARYARGIDAMEVRAVHAASDPSRANELIDKWIAFGYLAGIPLDVEECPDRNIERSLRRYVARFRAPDTEVTLILPRRHFPKRRHLLLHDRTSRRIARAFADVPHVVVVAVPYNLTSGTHPRPEPAGPQAEGERSRLDPVGVPPR
jgi:amino acid transporter